MSKVVIMSGPSGSGKSTLSKNIALALHSQNKVCQIFSTDNYWLRPDGSYGFNARELEQAHEWNLKKFKEFVKDSDFQKVDCTAIIDNTNLRWNEMKSYVEFALTEGWKVEIQRLNCELTPDELFARNVHQVPLQVIQRQVARWQSAEELNHALVELQNLFLNENVEE